MNTEITNHTAEDAARLAPVPERVQLPWHYTHTRELLRLRDSSTDVGSREINVAVRLDWGVYQTPAYFFVADETEAQPVLSEDGVVISAEYGCF
jgi:hypothetical protein